MNNDNTKTGFNFFKFVFRLGFVAVVLEIIVGILVGFGYGV